MDPSKGLGLFSTLRSARKPSHFVLAAVFVLFVDSVFISLGQPGVMNLANGEVKPDASFAVKLVLLFVLFSFFASIALELAGAFFDQIWINLIAPRIWLINYRTSAWFGERTGLRHRHRNHVTLYELKVAAHESKDSYLLKLLEEGVKSEGEVIAQSREFAICCFGMLLLVLWNDSFPNGTFSISSSATQYFGSTDWFWIAVGVLLTLTVARFHFERPERQIYCPTLFRELEARKKQERENLE